VRENVAVVFATLFKACTASDVLPHAQRYMTTATDVLRFIAVLSGTDGSLQREMVFKSFDPGEGSRRFFGNTAQLLVAAPATPKRGGVSIPLRVARFKIAKLSRSLRRALLAVLEGLEPERLVEDLLRHRSYWVWVGEFLHPHEYAARFPNVANAFQVVRRQAPDGTPGPAFQGWSGRVDEAMRAGDASKMLTLVAQRPGELARRLDHLLRLAQNDVEREQVVATFTSKLGAFATPVLLTLRSHLRTRDRPAAVRVYWPKGRVAKGVAGPDRRVPLSRQAIEPLLSALDAELLRRFASKERFAEGVVDEALRMVTVPFNERTASKSALSLPRGSRIAVPRAKLVRLFLHWCQPERDGRQTDLDLSVGLYDEAWQHIGVCSFYQLKLNGQQGALIAQSAGDLRDGPWPEGATELVDLDRSQALAAGARYAVMVVNNYSGMPFSQLERAFAGLMLRDDALGHHFDPRTVELKFALAGENGVFLPLVLDLRHDLLHWLDVHAKGLLEMNSVATSNSAITKICPELITYFESGVRTSMFDLGLLHVAARCERVLVRGAQVGKFVRRPGEAVAAFHARLVRGEADETFSAHPASDGPPTLAVLYRGDLDLPVDSRAYALFRERISPSLAASDLLS
jgi:hypothetical protein